MSEPAKYEDGAPVGPIAKDAIDPDLIKLQRKRPKIGVATCAGLVVLCAFFVGRLWPDRRFGANDDTPTKATVADVLAGKVGLDAYVSVAAEPLVSHAIRTTLAKTSLGLRVVPARGANEQLWLVVSGDAWETPNTTGYVGRLRRMADLPFRSALEAYTAEHPRPMFATAAAIRQGLTGGKLVAVGGEPLTIRDADRVALDVLDPDVSVIVASLNQRLPDAAAWKAALERAGLPITAETP
ncbi:MAG: hypothetical protein NT062_24235, partial [Proteobacteria bacterium]|nr:hypothetical protein [Pseudomonadota bacterium]